MMINKMKKYLLSIVMVVLGACTIQAASVDLQQAAQQARDFMSKNFSPSSHARRAAQTIPLNNVETGQSLVYAFNVEGGGFVVVAGDDCAPAILGYSEEAAIDPSDMPDGMKALFAQYQQEMQLMKSSTLLLYVSAICAEEKPAVGLLPDGLRGYGDGPDYVLPQASGSGNGAAWQLLQQQQKAYRAIR